MNEKLLKSFVLIEDVEGAKKGELFTLRRRQATIPLMNDLVFFDGESSRITLTMEWAVKNLWTKAKPNEFFKNNIEKFEHIS